MTEKAELKGKIIKGIAGFYYVHAVDSGVYECRARGIFRKQKMKPLVGDDVMISVIDRKDMTGNVVQILPRTSELARPAVANVDQALILFALTRPDPNFGILDRFIISAAQAGIPCSIFFNKEDLGDTGEKEKIMEIYRGCGLPLHFISVREGEGIDRLRGLLRGKTTVLAGPSGAGKSSLVNALAGKEKMETGKISERLARGKNTTRHAELIALGENTFILDTPGFTSLATVGLKKEELERYFAEFEPYIGKCRFQGCAHMEEPGCAVKAAVQDGEISEMRYASYRKIWQELREEERRKY